jgi:hypothetical protein
VGKSGLVGEGGWLVGAIRGQLGTCDSGTTGHAGVIWWAAR